MACSTITLKRFAIFWDTLYALLGASVIGTGIYIVYKFHYFTSSGLVIIGLGLCVALIALIGCWGACRESSRMTKSFAAILVVFIVLQLLVICFFWIFKTMLLINLDKTFDQMWREQPLPIPPGNASQIANLERWLECCGNTGPDDYILTPYSCFNNNGKKNLDGCRQKFLDYISNRWTALNIFVLALVVVEAICVSFAFVLANNILNRWRRSKYYSK